MVRFFYDKVTDIVPKNGKCYLIWVENGAFGAREFV